jgi:hypothetical protein
MADLEKKMQRIIRRVRRHHKYIRIIELICLGFLWLGVISSYISSCVTNVRSRGDYIDLVWTVILSAFFLLDFWWVNRAMRLVQRIEELELHK